MRVFSSQQKTKKKGYWTLSRLKTITLSSLSVVYGTDNLFSSKNATFKKSEKMLHKVDVFDHAICFHLAKKQLVMQFVFASQCCCCCLSLSVFELLEIIKRTKKSEMIIFSSYFWPFLKQASFLRQLEYYQKLAYSQIHS